MNKILISAYDVNPYQGSESATGWNYPLHLAKYNKVTVVTRENNLPEISRYIAEKKLNTENIEFVGFDLPYWARFWKRGARGSFLYFYLWQFFLALTFFSKRGEFDICHGLNFHCDWAPSFLWFLGKPLVWGPINHNEPLPPYILENLTTKEIRREKVKQLFKWFFWNLDPFLYLCKKKANKILVGHPKVITRLNLAPIKCVLFNQIATELRGPTVKKNNDFNVLFIGRGLLIKNHLTVLNAFKKVTEVIDVEKTSLYLTFVGVGKKAKNELLNEAAKLNIATHIKVYEWVTYDDIGNYYLDANVFCFPSFEGAGMVLAEALSYGLPVITIDRNGAAHELCEESSFVINSSNKDGMVQGVAEAITSLVLDNKKSDSMGAAAFSFAQTNLSWDAKAKAITKIYDSVL